MKMTLFERIIKYHDFDDESRPMLKIANWFDDKTEDYESPEIGYFFWNALFLSYLFFVVMMPQAFVISYYWIESKKYPLRVCIHDINNLHEKEEDIEKWCKDNNVDMFCLYKFFDKDLILYDDYIDENNKHDFAFRNEADVMAFKLAWI